MANRAYAVVESMLMELYVLETMKRAGGTSGKEIWAGRKREAAIENRNNELN